MFGFGINRKGESWAYAFDTLTGEIFKVVQKNQSPHIAVYAYSGKGKPDLYHIELFATKFKVLI